MNTLAIATEGLLLPASSNVGAGIALVSKPSPRKITSRPETQAALAKNPAIQLTQADQGVQVQDNAEPAVITKKDDPVVIIADCECP